MVRAPDSRTGRHTGYPICKNLTTQRGYNDLATAHPLIAKEANGWDPTKVGAGSEKKRNWTCNLGHSYQASPKSRTKKPVGTACPYCSGNRVKEGFNDLGTTHPQLAKEAYQWNPKTVVAGSIKKRCWICVENTFGLRRSTVEQIDRLEVDRAVHPVLLEDLIQTQKHGSILANIRL